MKQNPIHDVSDTALWVAALRAMESERRDPLFHDPLADKLAGQRGREIVKGLSQSPAVGWFVAIRTIVIDAFIQNAIADGVDCVLNLGAGYDTRPYRLRLPASLQWIEVDYPHVIDHKVQTLGNTPASCQLERVKLDLGQAQARQSLFSRVNQNAQKVMVLTEGVIPYLSNANVSALAGDLHAQAHFALWVVDYYSPVFIEYMEKTKMRRDLVNAPFQFRPDDWFDFFRQRGWGAKSMKYMAEEGPRLRRRPPSPWWMIALSLFMSASKRQAMQQMSGYGLLERL